VLVHYSSHATLAAGDGAGKGGADSTAAAGDEDGLAGKAWIGRRLMRGALLQERRHHAEEPLLSRSDLHGSLWHAVAMLGSG
jgi:hypothetical protein